MFGWVPAGKLQIPKWVPANKSLKGWKGSGKQYVFCQRGYIMLDVIVLKCTDCGYEAESLDCLIMHENQEHYTLSVTIIESAVDKIIDLPKKKRKKPDTNINSNIKKLKYRLYY